MSLFIVVPCYNEAQRLDMRAFARFAAQQPNVSFLFVNDGSRDKTGEMLDAVAATAPERFDVLHLAKNGGKGEAVRQGLLQALRGFGPPLAGGREARGGAPAAAGDAPCAAVGYWDADLATPLSAIRRFRQALEERPEVEAVLGSRVKRLGARVERSPLRHYLGRAFATAASLALRRPVYDTQCGAKLFRATPELQAALETPFCARWVFDVELLARLAAIWGRDRSLAALCELPLEEWRDVPGSKVRLVHMLQAPWDLAKIYWGDSRARAVLARGKPAANASAASVDAKNAGTVRRGLRARPGRSSSLEIRQGIGRAGATLVELLVVIAIVSLLMAVLLPAVQMARESARRMQCSGNLRQVGLAVHAHQDLYGTLPTNTSPFFEGPRPELARHGRGWIVGALPFLEQQPLFDEFQQNAVGDFFAGGGLKSPACLPLVQTRLANLRCPSDDTGRGLSATQYQWEGTEIALTCYKGVIGDTRMGGSQSFFSGTEPDCHSSGGCNGLYWRGTYQEPVRLSDVLDGTSNTLLIGEDVPGQNDHSAAYYANGDYASCHAPLNYFPRPPQPRDWPNVMSFRSRHPGGAQFCLADGAVRFVAQTIEPPLYRALSTRAGGEARQPP